MKSYLDTSAFLACVFGQAGGLKLINRLKSSQEVLSDILLLSEAASCFTREKVSLDQLERMISWINLVSIPINFKTVKKIIQHGYVKGADLHHLCCAYTLADGANSQITFVSMNMKQLAVAKSLGFKVYKV